MISPTHVSALAVKMRMSLEQSSVDSLGKDPACHPPLQGKQDDLSGEEKLAFQAWPASAFPPHILRASRSRTGWSWLGNRAVFCEDWCPSD